MNTLARSLFALQTFKGEIPTNVPFREKKRTNNYCSYGLKNILTFTRHKITF